jgi:hypothetical protein
MRLPVVALFIALPAGEYVAVCPQQHSTDFEVKCAERFQHCSNEIPCCGDMVCKWTPFSTVRHMAHLL